MFFTDDSVNNFDEHPAEYKNLLSVTLTIRSNTVRQFSGGCRFPAHFQEC